MKLYFFVLKIFLFVIFLFSALLVLDSVSSAMEMDQKVKNAFKDEPLPPIEPNNNDVINRIDDAEKAIVKRMTEICTKQKCTKKKPMPKPLPKPKPKPKATCPACPKCETKTETRVVYQDRQILKPIVKHHSVHILAGAAPDGLVIDKYKTRDRNGEYAVRTDRGFVAGLRYQYQWDNNISASIEALSNTSVIGAVGFHFGD
jgi:hypothetical protein